MGHLLQQLLNDRRLQHFLLYFYWKPRQMELQKGVCAYFVQVWMPLLACWIVVVASNCIVSTSLHSLVHLCVCVTWRVFSLAVNARVWVRTGIFARMCKQTNCVSGSVWLVLNLADLPLRGNRPIFSVRHPVTALKEKMEIPSSSSLASKWRMSPPINHRDALTDSWLPNIHLH